MCLVLCASVWTALRPAAASAATPLGTNLIVNPGAELGTAGEGGSTTESEPSPDAPPDWTTTGDFTQISYSEDDGYPTTVPGDATPGPGDPGNAFFGGGYPTGAASTATQTIQVADLAAQIDGGTIGYDLSGWLGGYSDQGDSMEVVLTFQNGSGTALGTAQIGPVTPGMRDDTTELLQQESSGAVPAGTRSVQVEMVTDVASGPSDDGYADDLSLELATINKVTVTAPVAQTATVGTPFGLAISAADSDASQTLTYAATGLPGGLSIDPATGEISGTPQAAQTSTVTVTATDTTGSVGSASFSLVTSRQPGDLTVGATLSPTSPSGQSGWYTGPVTVTPAITGGDDAVQVEATVDGGAPAIVSAPLPVTGDGAHTITLTATDAAGDIAPPDTFTIEIDATPPTSAATVQAATRTVQITASDPTSGVSAIQYQLNGGNWTTAAAGQTTASVPVGAGRTAVGYRAVDNAGNVEPAQTVIVAGAAPVPSTVALTVPSTLAYGQSGEATVTVAAAAQTPTGTVTLSDGSRALGVYALSGGVAKIALPATLAVGTHRLTAAYSGDAGAEAAASPARSVLVSKVRPRLSMSLTATAGRDGMRVTVAATGAGTALSGPVTATLTGHGLKGGRLVRHARLDGGRVTIGFGQVKAGSYRLTLTRAGDASQDKVTVTRRVRVRAQANDRRRDGEHRPA